jgi:hypothetical protein
MDGKIMDMDKKLNALYMVTQPRPSIDLKAEGINTNKENTYLCYRLNA